MYAEVVLRSRSGMSLILDAGQMSAKNIHLFKSDPERAKEARDKLEKAGFTVISASDFGFSITGPAKLFEKIFHVRILKRQVAEELPGQKVRVVTESFMADPPKVPTDLAALIETIYIPRRGQLHEGEGPMPVPDYFHIRPPEDVVRLVHADIAHDLGYRGEGVSVAMIDTGFFASHDYYLEHEYHITVHAPWFGSETEDLNGHGTGIAANLLAVAPECVFHFYKALDMEIEEEGFWWCIPAFRMAVADGCKVITCSWGLRSPDRILEAEILDAVENAGVVVIVSCGNDGYLSWPGYMPEVISVGGAYPLPEGGWEASTYASSGVDPIHPLRNCPDFCGIVGHAPKGILIIEPTMPGSRQDAYFSGPYFPNGDETASNDGWIVASGTSSAAPLVAGAAALMLQARATISPREIKRILSATCIDVQCGRSASGDFARIGNDRATGSGVINVGRAVEAVAGALVCPLGPIEVPPTCTLAPTVVQEICPRAPIVEEVCLRTPVPLCKIAPIVIAGPDDRCVAGPWEGRMYHRGITRRPEPEGPALSERIPVTIMVTEEELRSLLINRGTSSERIHETALQEEYRQFPKLEGRRKGPFNPSAEK